MRELLQLSSRILYNISNPEETCLCPLKSQTVSQRERDLNCRISSFPPQNLFCSNWLAGWCYGCTYVLNRISKLFSVAVVPVLQPARNPVSQELPLKRLLTAGRVILGMDVFWHAIQSAPPENKCPDSFHGRKAVTPQQATAKVHSSFC